MKRQCAYYGKKYGKTLGKLKEFTEEIEIFAEDKVFPPVLFMEAEVGRGAGQNKNLRLRGRPGCVGYNSISLIEAVLQEQRTKNVLATEFLVISLRKT